MNELYMNFPTDYDVMCKECRGHFGIDKTYKPDTFRKEVMKSWLANHDCIMKQELICRRAIRL